MGRVGRVLFPAILVLALYYALFGGEYSIFELRSARNELVRLQDELERLQEENDSLRAWADSLETDRWTIERLAREEHGLVRDGEEIVRITGGESPDTSRAPEEGRDRP